MRKNGYYQSHSDHTLFVKQRNDKVTTLIIYVDDIIITGDDSEEIVQLEKNLAAEFEMKSLGDLKYFLGVEVAYSSQVDPGKGILCRTSGHLEIEGFTNADWAGDVTDKRSTSGYFTFVGGNLVTWRSKK
ncbi:uncharacterized mitochondrial protein AtMg00810-like [Pyrus x bretschneideri]|uniref:uncharacterized mitochondrial protein AtMg00810-like n=1 Tax=Pyrus x bretschneideri TaxID=225117 RepID=UPI00202E786E|nr:uncharacterized mitochondrial protein AtMg00810-like [Pyrus x bretschneideri]